VNRRHPHNYGFVIISSGCRWTFGWNIDKKLNCRIQRIPKAKLREQQEFAAQADEKRLAREANHRAWEDVTVIIGEPHRCRSFTGETQMSPKIPLAEFESWTKVTIDINKPKEIVHTEHGDLILDPEFKGKLYLHGLELPSGSKSGKAFDYAYNLLSGRLHRDRGTVSDARIEAQIIARIWRTVLLVESRAGKWDFCRNYCLLLISHYSADVHESIDCIEEDVASLVWNFVQKMKLERAFFHRDDEDTEVNLRDIHIPNE
jgi:hypothetical protein